MEKRCQQEHTPPPTPEETRRQLGWDLIKEQSRQNKNK